jgi:hypothetical protein
LRFHNFNEEQETETVSSTRRTKCDVNINNEPLLKHVNTKARKVSSVAMGELRRTAERQPSDNQPQRTASPGNEMLNNSVLRRTRRMLSKEVPAREGRDGKSRRLSDDQCTAYQK